MQTLPLHNIEAITFEDVVRFCKAQKPENVRLEYKQGFSSKNRGRQIAKEVAAFANTQGGIIIFGVQEEPDGSRKPVACPEGMDLGSDPRDAIISACADLIWPPVQIDVSDFLPNPADPNKGFVVISVPVSDDAPHTVDDGTGIFVRVLDQSRPVLLERATDDQIERMLLRRRQAKDLQDARRKDALRRLYVDPKKGSVWISVGPRVNADALFTPQQLCGLAYEFSVPSVRQPIDRSTPIWGVMDGILGEAPDHRQAALYDIWGNVLFSRILGRAIPVDETFSIEMDRLRRRPQPGQKAQVIDASAIAEAVLITLHAANEVYGAANFVGPLVLDAGLTETLGYFLMAPTRSGPRPVGIYVDDANPRWRETTDTRELEALTERCLVAYRLLERIIWASGCTDVDLPIDVTNWVACNLYDKTLCQMCSMNSMPIGSDMCLSCRLGRR